MAEVEKLRLPSDPVHANVVRPPSGSERGAAVVVISGSGGGDAMSTGMARALADARFPALGLGYFKVPGRPDDLRDIAVEYVVDAVAALRARCSTAAVVLLGASRGSEAAMLVASHHPDLVQGVIGLVPADKAFGSWPPGGAGWTIGGRPVTPESDLEIERFGGPVLLVSAGQDEVWPSAAMAQVLEARLAGAARPCRHLTYPEATHALSYLAPVPGGDGRPADIAAREDAWPQVLAMLELVASPAG